MGHLGSPWSTTRIHPTHLCFITPSYSSDGMRTDARRFYEVTIKETYPPHHNPLDHSMSLAERRARVVQQPAPRVQRNNRPSSYVGRGLIEHRRPQTPDVLRSRRPAGYANHGSTSAYTSDYTSSSTDGYGESASASASGSNDGPVAVQPARTTNAGTNTDVMPLSPPSATPAATQAPAQPSTTPREEVPQSEGVSEQAHGIPYEGDESDVDTSDIEAALEDAVLLAENDETSEYPVVVAIVGSVAVVMARATDSSAETARTLCDIRGRIAPHGLNASYVSSEHRSHLYFVVDGLSEAQAIVLADVATDGAPNSA